MNIYDEKKNVRQLERMSIAARGVFALGAATRILPSYRRFHLKTGLGLPDRLEELGHQLWISSVELQQREVLEARVREIEALIPSEDESWDEETQPYAEDAAAAIAYAARARLTGSSQEAAWAGRRVFEAIDYFVDKTIPGHLPDKERLSLALSHPLVQAELARQDRDLHELAAWDKASNPLESLRRFRTLAEQEAKIFFG